MEEFLTTEELCERIKYRRQTIYNLIHRKILVLGKHFFKPTPRKILFKWSEVLTWMGEGMPSSGGSTADDDGERPMPARDGASRRSREISLIRI